MLIKTSFLTFTNQKVAITKLTPDYETTKIIYTLRVNFQPKTLGTLSRKINESNIDITRVYRSKYYAISAE